MQAKEQFIYKSENIAPDRISCAWQCIWLKSTKTPLKRAKTRVRARGFWQASVISFASILLLVGCASVQRPTGGPRDEEAPKLENASPKNLSTKFSAKTIRLTFDEYIKLQNEFREITFAPEIENLPDIKNKGKELEITFKEPLLPNTTYTINFGEAILDVNEGNKLKNFTYVFSTGEQLDSLRIKGKVRNSFTQLPEKEILVFILSSSQNDKFGIKKPSFFTKTDTAGNYELQNLKDDTYFIYALKDTNIDRLYQQGTEEIAYHDQIVLNQNKENIDLYLFKELPAQIRNLEKKIEADGSIMLTFNRPIIAPNLKITAPQNLDQDKFVQFNKTLDTAKLWVKNHQFDSLNVAVIEKDTVLQNITLSRGKNENYASTLQPTFNLEDGTRLNPYRPLELKFNTPLTSIDPSKITLKEDSIMRTNFQANIDPNRPNILVIDYPWREVNYELTLADGAVKAWYNYSNRQIFKKIDQYNLKNYGRLDISFKTPDSIPGNYIIELLNDKSEILKSDYTTKDTTIIFQNYRVGKYFVRVIYDTNKNEKWDSGSLKQRKAPEKIWYDPRSFTIRNNWEVKEVVQIPLP